MSSRALALFRSYSPSLHQTSGRGIAGTLNTALMTVPFVATGLAPICGSSDMALGPDKAHEEGRRSRHRGSQFSLRGHCSQQIL